MLFKFASYLLGTNNEEKAKPEQQLNFENNDNQDTQPDDSVDENIGTLTENRDKNLLTESNEKKDNLIDKKDLIQKDNDNYMYAEQLVYCSELRNSNFNLESDGLNKEDQLCDQLEDDEDCEDDHWIYITPIKCKNEDEKETSEDESELEEEEEDEEDEENSLKNQEIEKEKFNFYDYFNNKCSGLTSLNEKRGQFSPIKSKTTSSSSNKSTNKMQKLNRIEESWVIHPPPCFTIDNTFTIEEHPLENLYIENPALSVMASCKSMNKESTRLLTNSSVSNTGSAYRVLIERNVANNQTKFESKSLRKRTNSTRKTSKKQNASKKSKKPSKKNELPSTPANQTVEQTKEIGGQNQRVLNGRQLLAYYLMNTNQLNAASESNTIASSNGSTHHQSENNHHSLNHTHHYISNNRVKAIQVQKNSSEHKKGKSLKRNNKVVKRDNLSNKPFTLHRKLC